MTTIGMKKGNGNESPGEERSGTPGRRRRDRRPLLMVVAAALLLAPLGLLGGSSAASAATPMPVSCSGTLAAGTYSSVTVTGTCAVSAGQVVVTGGVTVQAGTSLVAAYALNAGAPSTTSGLTVIGDINVASGGTLILGCEASHFSCLDDPGNPSSPTLNSSDSVSGSVIAANPLGVLVHDSSIGGDATQSGGGGGVSCTPTGIFATLLTGSPAYSDYEDNTIGGNLRVTTLSSCWFGAVRNHIGGSATFTGGTFLDPDASENLSNQIAGNLLCSGNSPAIQYGDSVGATANVVGGFATGECAFSVMQPQPAPSGPLTHVSMPSSALQGYWLAAKDGGVFTFGVPFLGSEGGQALSQPIAGMAAVPGGGSYNLANSNGTLYGHGPHAADCAGATGTLNKPVVGITAAPGGNGCWIAAADGGVFTFGSNTSFYGSTGALTLNKPIVGIAAAPTGNGYDLVAADGGVFTFGPGAAFHGSTGGQHLNQPIVGMTMDPTTGGYWLVAADGGVFSFNAPFLGSLGGMPLNKPIVGIAAAPTGDGYYLVAADGGIFTFGTGAHFQGSTGSLRLNQPIVGMALG